MPIDFPASPTTNQTYTYNNKVWVYSGTAWVGGTVISALPAGSVQMYAAPVTQSTSVGVVTTTAPSGWLLANGDAVSRTTYSTLFAAVGTTYGAGNGSTTFNLPDMRSRVPIAVGTGTGLTARTLGGTVGAESHTVSSSNIQSFSTGFMSTNASHTHDIRMRADNSVVSGNYILATSGTSVTYNNTSTGGTNGGGAGVGDGKTVSTSVDHTHTVGTASPTGINHMPPSIGLNFIIKT